MQQMQGMEHLLIRSHGRDCLLVDLHASADGHGIGYGMMLIRMRRALLVGQLMRTAVFFVHPARALNRAVMALRSPQVEVIPHQGWLGRWLACVWMVAAPFRVGAPRLWLQRSLARLLLGRIYTTVERTRWLPRRARRWLTRRRPVLAHLKAANVAYAARSHAQWDRVYEQALARGRALERAGLPPPRLSLHLPPPHDEAAARAAARHGISSGAAIVTVHVRESGYRASSDLRQRGWDASRNAGISSYRKAFAALVERGYTVVRLGDSTMTPVNLPGVVDLATSADSSQLLELWCVARSGFFIGSDSGPSWLAALLDVPLLTVNAVHFRDLARPDDRVVCKLARDRGTGAVLAIREMLTESYLRAGFKNGRFEPVDNTPSDLRQAVLDMIDVVEGRETRSPWQGKFNRRLRDLKRQTAMDWSALDGVAIMSRAKGTLSQSFARKYYNPR